MRIVESQSAVLSNYEVYQHLVDQRQRYRNDNKRRGPPNLETVVREVGPVTLCPLCRHRADAAPPKLAGRPAAPARR